MKHEGNTKSLKLPLLLKTVLVFLTDIVFTKVLTN